MDKRERIVEHLSKRDHAPLIIGQEPQFKILPLERAAHLAKCIGTIQSAIGLFGQLGIDPRYWTAVRDDVLAEIEDLILEAHKERLGFADEPRGELEELGGGRFRVLVSTGYTWRASYDFHVRDEAQAMIDEIKETGELP